ncbi:parallel beta-helix repeat protein [Stanieria cyanosphaera PCC 7437]|uniref:Parallel beta-helix repeat protein n=1 Tax=Stanieria cyanosphaera (strain ATCC 29371 / PCC 7437) TaxID=111780 RepID=K9XPC7_STAC7|nr:DUF1565 domain-containing protein [Stanieria cyanosphaera]AFZ33901.1 parallel beta-helix repeat protein [Stanieria cyanosphaera PCC 7437]
MSYQPRNLNIIRKTYFFSLWLACAFSFPLGNLVFAQSVNSQLQVSSETNIIYVDPQTGNDRGEGTQPSPLKTITQALQQALPNTTIALAPGTYNEETGEKFPLIIKTNVTLRGASGGQGSNVIIEGSGYFISPTAAGQYVTIAAIKNSKEITGVTVINPHSRGHGLWIESASPTVSNSSFIRNGNTGLSVNGNSAPIITNNYFHNNAGNGLLVYGTSKPQVKNNTFESTGFAVSVVQNAAPVLIGNSFSGNRIGVILEGNSQAVLHDNKIENSQEYGLVAIANAQADLGTTAQPGNNLFRNNGKLDLQNATNNPLLAVGTEIKGKTEGEIDFRGTITQNRLQEVTATATKPSTDLVLNAISPQQSVATTTSNQTAQILPSSSPIHTNLVRLTSNETLPSPKPVPVPDSPPPTSNSSPIVSSPPALPTSASDTNSVADSNPNKELVFTASTNHSISESNFPPQPSTITNLPRNQVNTLSDVFGSEHEQVTSPSPITAKYRVLVEANHSSQQSQVRSLFPDAFTTVYLGKSMLQVGAFSNKDKAEGAFESLQNLGLKSYLLQ